MIMKKSGLLTLAVAGSLALSGCTTTGPKQQQGALLGGAGGLAAGALIGNAVGGRDGALVGAAIGGIAGALIGSEIGREMDERDRALHDAAVKRAYAMRSAHAGPVHQTWYNPATGNRGEIKVLRAHDGNPNCAVFVDTYYKKGSSGPIRDENQHCAGADGSF